MSEGTLTTCSMATYMNLFYSFIRYIIVNPNDTL